VQAPPGARTPWDAASVTQSMDGPVEAEAATTARAVILVEGASDRLALESLASRRGRDLRAEGVSVLAMGGAGNIGRFLDRFGPRGLALTLAGLCDEAEEPDFRRGLERAGFGSDLASADMERLGFHVCVEDLEDELIRALGAEAVVEVIEARGELGAFRTLQKQPDWRGRPIERQLRRFLGNRSRKIECAPLFVEALDLSRVPRPLDEVLQVGRATAGSRVPSSCARRLSIRNPIETRPTRVSCRSRPDDARPGFGLRRPARPFPLRRSLGKPVRCEAAHGQSPRATPVPPSAGSGDLGRSR
jgi:hypothetical protein